MKHFAAALTLSLLGTGAFAQDFTVAFDWEGLKRCTSGQPNTVGNPVFTLDNVPAGTKWLYFKLTDLDVPRYNHGGGWIAYAGNETDAGVFKYKSPCPPSGKHTYEWEVTAAGSQDLKDALGVAAQTKRYP